MPHTYIHAWNPPNSRCRLCCILLSDERSNVLALGYPVGAVHKGWYKKLISFKGTKLCKSGYLREAGDVRRPKGPAVWALEPAQACSLAHLWPPDLPIHLCRPMFSSIQDLFATLAAFPSSWIGRPMQKSELLWTRARGFGFRFSHVIGFATNGACALSPARGRTSGILGSLMSFLFCEKKGELEDAVHLVV